ncbi:MAG: NUDIX hydrolase [Litorimonas sp.]
MKLPTHPYQWREQSRSAKFENPWMRVEQCRVTDPSGLPRDYGLVHFKNKAVGIIPYQDGHIWLVGQSRFAMQSYSWEIPAGGCPAGEDMLETAQRELREETGMRAQSLQPISRFALSNSITDETGVLYLATQLTAGQTDLESSEDISLLKLTLDDAYKAVETGQISQAISIMAIHKLMLMRHMGELS